MKDLIDQLTGFYQALNHQQVIGLIEAKPDLSRFRILEDKYYRIWIPKSIVQPVPLLVAHSDTVFSHIPRQLLSHQGKICSGDKRVGLGADDRNGCWLLSSLMQKRPDDFIFALFDLEEQGCQGSASLPLGEILDTVSVIIGLDRQGGSDLALYGFENAEFLEILSGIQGYENAFGTMSDCAILAEAGGICCFNISVGYYRQHTPAEYTILADLLKAERLLLDLPDKFRGRQYKADLYDDLDNELYADPLEATWYLPAWLKNERGRR